MSYNLYLATLQKDVPNPLYKESDEEKPKKEEAGTEETTKKKSGKKGDDTEGQPAFN